MKFAIALLLATNVTSLKVANYKFSAKGLGLVQTAAVPDGTNYNAAFN